MAKNVEEALLDITPKDSGACRFKREEQCDRQRAFTKYEVKRGLRDLNGKGSSCRTDQCFGRSRKRDCRWKRSAVSRQTLLSGL